jgi:hypothetical protein
MRGEVGVWWQALQRCGRLVYQLWPQVHKKKLKILGGPVGHPVWLTWKVQNKYFVCPFAYSINAHWALEMSSLLQRL